MAYDSMSNAEGPYPESILTAGSGTNLGEVGLGMQGIGAILGAIGSVSGVLGQKTALRTQSAIDQINATTAERVAQSALAAGQRQEQQSMLATANLKGKQITGFAANGLDLGEGSVARTLTSTDVMGAIDKNTIAANAVRQAWGYRTQASNYLVDAAAKQSQSSAMNPWEGGATSLLGSAGSVASNWYALNKTGANLPYYGRP